MNTQKMLTEDQQSRVEERLADLFAHEFADIAAELGFDFPYSAEQEAAINAEFDKRHRQAFIDLALQENA